MISRTLNHEKVLSVVSILSKVKVEVDPEVSIADDDWELKNETFKYREGDYLIEVG